MSALWPLILRSLAARRLRAALTVVAVGLGVAVMLGVQIGLDGLDSQTHGAASLRAGSSGLDVRATANGGLSSAQLAELGHLPGVLEVSPLHQKRVVARPPRSAGGVTVTLVGLREGAAALRPIGVISGRLPNPGSRNEVAVDAGLRTTLGAPGGQLQIADTVDLTTSAGEDSFRVVGITSAGTISASFIHNAVFLPDPELVAAFDLGLRTPLAGLRLAPGASSTGVAAAARRALGNTATTYDPRAPATQPLGQLAPLLFLVTVLSLVIGSGVSANSVSISALERRRDLGLLRAAGASRRQVFGLLTTEAGLLAILGATAGCVVGAGLGALLESAFASPDLPAPAFHVSAGVTTGIAALGVVTALLAASVPAAAAARARILDALRPETAGRVQRPLRGATIAAVPLLIVAAISASGDSVAVAVGALSALLAVGLLLPRVAPAIAGRLGALGGLAWPEARLAAANLVRHRNRTSLTMAGLVVAVAAAVSSSVLIAGSLAASDRWVSQLFVGESLVQSPVTQRDVIASDIATAAGGAGTTELRFFPAAVNNDVMGIAVIDSAVYASHGGLDVVDSNRSQAFADLGTGPRVLAPAGLAADNGWGRGSRLSVTTPRGPAEFVVAGIVAHSFPAGDGREALIIGIGPARQYFGPAAAGFDDLEVLTPGRSDAVAAVASRYGLSTVLITTIEQRTREALGRSIGLLLGVAGISIGIAMLAVVNTLAVSIRQGTRELGLLRAVGLNRIQALRLMFAEAALMALAAGIIGSAVGAVLALPMLHASRSPGFDPVFDIPLLIVPAIIVTIMVAAVVAVVLPARRAVSASIVSAMRQR